MGILEQIESAPKNGNVIILQNAAWQALGRWNHEANRWVHPDGTAVQFSPTHWKPPDASLPGDETEQGQKQPLIRLILILAFVVASCIAGWFFWIGSEDWSVNSAAPLEQGFSRQRDQASVDPARAPRNTVSPEILETQQTANSKQRELKQALDKSEARSEALAHELAETKQLADTRQMELKAALDESEKTVLALARELHDTISSADKPSSAEVTSRDAATPTSSLHSPMDELNPRSGITGSVPRPSERLQISSDAIREDASAVASEQLAPSDKSQPDRPQPSRAISPAEEAKLVARAESLIKYFDFASARLLLAHALEKGSARAAFVMAETYDWRILWSLQASGVRGDAQKAREFYQMAAAAGIEKARERVEALQSDANIDKHEEEEERSR
jgi:hypothetical protein